MRHKPVYHVARHFRRLFDRAVLGRAGRETQRRHGKRVSAGINCQPKKRTRAGPHRREVFGKQSVKGSDACAECKVHDLSACLLS